MPYRDSIGIKNKMDKNISKHVTLDETLDSSQVIHHYMKLEYFFKLLETRKFRINRKKSFPDKNEHELPVRCLFGIHAVGKNENPLDKEIIESEYKILHNVFNEYKDTKGLFTSCWTNESHENNLMWLAYTQSYGIRISSKVCKFVDSFQSTQFKIIGGEIRYQPYAPAKDVNKHLYNKNIYYKDEREVRFYFLPQTQIECSEKDSSIDLEINLNQMIDKVTISPYIHPILANIIKNYLESEYNFNANLSSIHIS